MCLIVTLSLYAVCGMASLEDGNKSDSEAKIFMYPQVRVWLLYEHVRLVWWRTF